MHLRIVRVRLHGGDNDRPSACVYRTLPVGEGRGTATELDQRDAADLLHSRHASENFRE